MNPALPEPSGAHRAALALHALSDADRDWVLQALTPQQQHCLQPLLEEVRALGLPRDAGLLEGVLRRDARDASPAADAPLRSLCAKEVRELARLLAAEPPRLAAALLAAHDWPWRDRLLAQLPPAFVLPPQEAPAGALAAAVAAELARRLQASRQGAAPASPWQRLRRELARWGARL